MTIEVVEFLQSMQTGFLDFFFNFISFLGEEYIYILILGIIYYAYDKKLGEFLAFTLFFSGVFNNVIKGLVSAKRPFEKYPDRVTNLRPETSTGHSFPSGHVQNFTTFLFSEAFWFNKKRIFIIASIFAILMALSRMYLGVHFLEDVLTSIALGVATAYVFYKVFKKYQDNDKALLKIYIGILIIFTPFLFILDGEDLFKSYGLLLGFIPAMQFEKSFVKFRMDVTLLKKAIRIVSGLVVMLTIQIGLGAMFDMLADEGTMFLNILDLLRYALIAFIGLGVYPLLFKRLNF